MDQWRFKVSLRRTSPRCVEKEITKVQSTQLLIIGRTRRIYRYLGTWQLDATIHLWKDPRRSSCSRRRMDQPRESANSCAQHFSREYTRASRRRVCTTRRVDDRVIRWKQPSTDEQSRMKFRSREIPWRGSLWISTRWWVLININVAPPRYLPTQLNETSARTLKTHVLYIRRY